MSDALNFQLFFGKYRCPRVRVGQKIDCEFRGREVVVGGLSDAPIMWPYVRQGGTRSLIVFGPLIKAIERESASAVAHNWGVTGSLVSQWRRALGVPRDTPGTKRLDARRIGKLTELSKSPEMRRYKSDLGKLRRKRGDWRSESERPYTREEVALLGTGSDASVARALGRSKSSVHSKRQALKIPAFCTVPRPFSAKEIALLGTDSDAAIAKRVRRHPSGITAKRTELGISSAQERAGKTPRPWTRREIAQLGRESDPNVAARLGRNVWCVTSKRRRLAIPPFHPTTPRRLFSDAEIALFGTDTDRAVAKTLGRHGAVVRRRRKELGIPAFEG
jgi:hypothetical protein